MDNLKNIVVLKNLPSNIIEEAFLILKPNQKIKNVEYASKQSDKKVGISKEYIVKEAEMVISSYLNKNDSNRKKEIELQNLRKVNKKLKTITIVLLAVMVIATITNIFI